MGCSSCGPKNMAKYVCKKCGKEEIREVKERGSGKELLWANYGEEIKYPLLLSVSV